MAIQLLRLEELTGHDVYEFAYAHAYPGGCWWPQSLYLTDDDDGLGIDALTPSLDQVFPQFAYLAPQQVSMDQWAQVEKIHCAAHPEDVPFFQEVAAWLEQGNRGADYFWILGY